MDTLNSISSQTVFPTQVIIKDGINRAEPNFIQSYRFTCTYDCSPDYGIYDGMNKALSHVSTKYVLFLNSGDRLFSAYSLETAQDIISNNKNRDPLLLFFGWSHTGANKTYFPSISPLRFNHQAIIYSLSIHDYIGNYIHSKGFYSADYLFFYIASSRYNHILSNYTFSCIDPTGVSSSLRTPLNVACIKYLHGDVNRFYLVLLSLLHPIVYYFKSFLFTTFSIIWPRK